MHASLQTKPAMAAIISPAPRALSDRAGIVRRASLAGFVPGVVPQATRRVKKITVGAPAARGVGQACHSTLRAGRGIATPDPWPRGEPDHAARPDRSDGARPVDVAPFALLAALILAYALVGGRLARSPVTMPQVFLAAGLVAGLSGNQAVYGDRTLFQMIAEATLALLLFADAAMLGPRTLGLAGGTALRMLLLGMPLALAIGAVVAAALFPGWPIWAILLLAALLVPTDAALGAAVLANHAIPRQRRTALAAESGLNDGLALPAILFFACAAVGSQHDQMEIGWGLFATLQIGGGLAVGATAGGLAGWALARARAARWCTEEGTGIAILGLIALIYFGSEIIHANGFIAVFVAGFAFARAGRTATGFAKEFAETDGQLLAMLSFFTIGAVMAPEALAALSWAGVALVAAALFVVRPLAIWLAMAGSGAPVGEKLFYGWFGPRGLATAVFAANVVAAFPDLPHGDTILSVAVTAVLASAVLHGISAHFAPQLALFRSGDRARHGLPPGNGHGKSPAEDGDRR
ncbi:MAG TPA: sodium:potassium antiporter [Rhodobacteraceae bacterium]|nr:sodium:potassium antiporter [Paracoccaceae bacterium]